MKWGFDRRTEALRAAIPWGVLVVALALSAAGWLALEHSRYVDARMQFDRRTGTAVATLRARIASYEQILRSGAARVASSSTLSKQEWHEFVDYLQLPERYPGIQAIGYAEVVSAADRPAHVQRMRSQGFADYGIRPPGVRDLSVVVVYNEPYTGSNAREVGVDMFAEPARRAAMERARDSADAAITGKIQLAGEAFRSPRDRQPGFIMYVPVFRDASRRAAKDDPGAISGYVLSPFRVHDLMRGILDEGVLQVLDMRIFDEPGESPDNELIDTRTAWRSTPPGPDPEFDRVVRFPMPGRTWTIHFVSRPAFDAALSQDRPWGVLAASVAASLVVFLLTRALVATLNRAHHLSMRDPLTGLFNRRYLEETMGREVPRARRAGEPMGLIVLDIDHFKRLNDSHGHDAGDFVLGRVGEMLRKGTREGDIACRFGGEEFAVILPGASLASARNRAEAIRATFEAAEFVFAGKKLGPMTLSAGISALQPDSGDWSQALQEADRALYTAKEAGRNRVLAVAAE
jgi:diguanylate cyclase (GGDEF)-like protein